MNDPRFRIPPSTRPIRPSPVRRLAFAGLGLLAAGVRLATWPWRAAGPRHPRAILVLEPYGMGDVLALQPLVRAWCAAGFQVTVGARAEWHALLPQHAGLTYLDLRPAWSATDARRKYRGLWHGPGSLPDLRRRLAPHARGVRGVDVRGDVRSVLLLHLAGCASVDTLTHYFAANDCRVFPGAGLRHPVDRGVERWRLNAVFALADGLTLEPPCVAHLLPPAAPRADAARVALIPLTPWAGKRWPPESWAAVARGLRGRALRPVALCGPGERRAAEAAVGGGMDIAECPHVAGWVATLAGCGAAVTVNTGPMHLAAALGLPLAVVEGSSRLPLWAPYSATARVLHHQDAAACAPCHQVGEAADCACRCMARVTPEEVLAAFDELRTAVQPPPSTAA